MEKILCGIFDEKNFELKKIVVMIGTYPKPSEKPHPDSKHSLGSTGLVVCYQWYFVLNKFTVYINIDSESRLTEFYFLSAKFSYTFLRFILKAQQAKRPKRIKYAQKMNI
jgi:hypothetical protein